MKCRRTGKKKSETGWRRYGLKKMSVYQNNFINNFNLNISGAAQPGGEPGGDSERAEAARAAAAEKRGGACRARADLAAAGAQHHDGSAAAKHG